ncbi:MAG: hypothetical protein L0Z50_33240, partial [Verrucomicrobiales bacterium]|nr:hypothetical protein [Verrucomicrobiales bacterium]
MVFRFVAQRKDGAREILEAGPWRRRKAQAGTLCKGGSYAQFWVCDHGANRLVDCMARLRLSR